MEEKRDKSNISTKKPRKTKSDYVHTTSKALILLVPYVGGSAAEIFSAIIAPPISKRYYAWIESIAEGVVELQRKFDEFDIANLQNNETFISLLMQATLVAIRNHQKEKLDALRNAVLNSALSSNVEEDQQYIFLNIIDIFTPTHLRILKGYANYPNGYIQNLAKEFQELGNKNLPQILEELYPLFPETKNQEDLNNHPEFYSKVFADLHNHVLLDFSDFLANGIIRDLQDLVHYAINSSLTNMGKQFIEFIKSPI